jgi:membrane fusion protein (multidrug efflux system)
MNRKWGSGLLAVGVLTTLFVVGYLPRQRGKAQRALAASRLDEAAYVTLVHAKPGKAERVLRLPGSLAGLETASIHARASGFVRRWLVDLGDDVKHGQLLAELDTPELDREIEQAEASLAQSSASIELSKASLAYSKSTLQRIQVLHGRKLTSKQELEQLEAQSNVDAAKVMVAESGRAEASANLHRLRQLKSFARIVAPFNGTVTARNLERGALVTAGGTTALFEVSTLNPLRVLVDVPQGLALGVTAGSNATVSVPELAGFKVEGTIARTARALDASSRTLRVEIQLPNDQGKLLRGMYANVEMTLPNAHVLLLPASALVTRSEGVRVAVVDDTRRVRLVPVVVARDNGAEVEIASGISIDQQIVANPGPAIVEGSLVRFRREAAKVVTR